MSALAAPHWSLVPPQRPEGREIVGHPVDVVLGGESSGRAPAHTLVRRLSWDLRGLAPTPEEVAEFAADAAPDAWDKLVKRFLASPHFGERMAQNWFDLARFADTSGYAADRTRTVWPYREWVIAAFNDNKPYDAFIVEQLAGDLLPDPTPDQRLATGFHRHAMQAKGNNPRKEEFRVKTVVDRLQTTGRAFLGLSFECAECHDHKYDPISQREYYQLFAIFNNVPHLGSGYDTHGPRMRYLPRALQAEREKLLAAEPGFSMPESAKPLRENFDLTGDLTITATIRTEAALGTIASKNDWQGGQRSYVFGVGGEGEKNATPGHLYAWISAQTAPWAGVEIYGSQAVNDGSPHEVALVFEAGKSVQLVVDGVVDQAARILGGVPGSIAVSARPLSIGATYGNSEKAEAFPFEGELTDVSLYALVPELGGASRLAEITKQTVEVPVMEELPEPRETHILVRGDYKQKGERVSPGVPAVLPAIGVDRPNRLDFARWLVRRDHPLTARVAVNYLWQHFFGEGLVATPADFGVQGTPPSNQELLDWLATEFIESGWDSKHMVRLIVSSEAYRSSAMARRRLPAEQIRDHFLSVSGLLDPRIGGPSVFPPQPAGFYEERGQNEPGNSNFTWKQSPGTGHHRKSMYIYWKRMGLHPSLAAFGAPPRQVCIARRGITNTPQQALVALNDPMFDECARAFAKRIEVASKDEGERVRMAFQLCLSRDPDPQEAARFRAFVARDGWYPAAAVLLNLDEALTRE